MSNSRLDGSNRELRNHPYMLLTAIKVKLAALVVVAGLNTDELPGISTEMKSTLEALAADQKAAAENPGKGPDVNASFNKALAKVRELAQKDDPDANFALAHWGVLSNSNVNINEVVELYRKAANKGHVQAKAELGQVLLQAFGQDPTRVEEAITLIQEAETANSPVARRVLATLYLNGAAKLPQDTTKALALLEKGSAANDGEATLGLSQVYAQGVTGVKADPAKSLEYLIKASDQGNAVAMSSYAARLFDGDPSTDGKPALVKKDPEAALTMFQKAADKGFAAANRLLAAIYENGLGGNAKDLKKSIEYYYKAANGNDAQALFRLGNYFEAGLRNGTDEKAEVLIAPNPKNALDLYRLAAQNGLAEAFFNVGVFYETGTVVDKDLEKAFQFHLRAAGSGLREAQHRLAGLYQNGGGVAQDQVAAFGWYQRAAQANYAPSQIALGMMYEQGAGTAANGAAAAQEYTNAAQQGAPLAMLRLASLYQRGIKGEPELARSWAFAQMAVDASNSAEAAVQFRDAVQKTMTAEQIAEGKKIHGSLKSTMLPAAPAGATTPAAAPAEGGTPKAGTKKGR